jgi:hypothetical protein
MRAQVAASRRVTTRGVEEEEEEEEEDTYHTFAHDGHPEQADLSSWWLDDFSFLFFLIITKPFFFQITQVKNSCKL